MGRTAWALFLAVILAGVPFLAGCAGKNEERYRNGTFDLLQAKKMNRTMQIVRMEDRKSYLVVWMSDACAYRVLGDGSAVPYSLGFNCRKHGGILRPRPSLAGRGKGEK